jgi:hypothetical protein
MVQLIKMLLVHNNLEFCDMEHPTKYTIVRHTMFINHPTMPILILFFSLNI